MHPRGPRDIKSRLIARTKEDIPHLVGQNFADAIDACLRFQELPGVWMRSQCTSNISLGSLRSSKRRQSTHKGQEERLIEGSNIAGLLTKLASLVGKPSMHKYFGQETYVL